MKRPFNALKTKPQSRYDAVVIGAGVGGLICANLLAGNGLRVLLIEQHYMVGGFCSMFRRKGYTFDAATHFYPLLGNPQTLTGRLLAELGVATGWIKMDPVDQFHFPDGSCFSVPADFNRYLSQLKGEFPQQAVALDDFFSAVREANMYGLLAYFRDRDTPRLDKYRHLTVQQVLDRYFDHRKLKLLLTADCPHWGSPPSRTSFVFDAMLRLSYFLGNYYPQGGSQAFVDALAQRFESLGGHIAMRSLVRRILVRHHTAYGVEVEIVQGRRRYSQQILAHWVVSNADIRQTFEQMVDPQHLEAGYLQAMRDLRPTYPCFLTYLGLRDVPSEVLRTAHGYYWNAWDPNQVGQNGFRFKVFVPTLYDPSLAPPGGHIVIIQKVLDLDYNAIDDWEGHKADIERYIMQCLEGVIPGIGEKIVVKLSATAQTAYKFTRNYVGAMLGWEMSPDQLGSHRLDVVSPIDNLYCVGHWVRPGGGITPVIVSAMKVAALLTRTVAGMPVNMG